MSSVPGKPLGRFKKPQDISSGSRSSPRLPRGPHKPGGSASREAKCLCIRDNGATGYGSTGRSGRGPPRDRTRMVSGISKYILGTVIIVAYF